MSLRSQLKVISAKDGDLTPQMRKFGDEAASRAAGKTREQLVDLGKEVGMKEQVRARYKIEITFGPDRKVHGPSLVGIQVWESGRRLNGGGDDLAFWCQSTDSEEGCWGIITSNNLKGGIGFCPHCKKGVNADLLTNMKIGRVMTKKLANDVEKLFWQLEGNADIYVKYHMADPHYIAMARAKGPEVARRLKGMHIYPLKNLLSDTAHGATTFGRILAFLTS